MFGKKKDAGKAPTPEASSPRSSWRRLPTSPLPSFYRDAIVLDAKEHGDWALAKDKDMSFARDIVLTPLTPAEFPSASASFPIVFVEEDDIVIPVGVLGARGENRFIETGGAWREDAYMPAFLRRYPFIGALRADEDLFALAIDPTAACVLKAPTAGARPLFEAGGPSVITKNALQLCKYFHHDHAAGLDFAAGLAAAGVLRPAAAGLVLGNERPFAAHGFLTVDVAAMEAMERTLLADWSQKGWLALIESHLASQAMWSALQHAAA